MNWKYLPEDKNTKIYSPIGVRNLFKEAVLEEEGNIQAIFDKSDKYKSLIELWYASALAVAVYKWTGEKFFMYSSENPDIHFIKINNNKK